MHPISDETSGRLPDLLSGRADVSAALTYEPFFGLREKPFSLSADPRFLFKSPAHAPAFDGLLAAIRRREGLIVLTGEIGTGKTTLCRSVLQQLDRRTFASFVADPFVSREDLLKTLLVDFGVISMADLARGRFNGASRSDLSYPLYEFLDSLAPLQAFAVVVIDEAQNLSLPLLEEIRVLSELERREKLLQVVLVGQPELRAKLRLPEMRQVHQRVSVRCELSALDAGGVAGYLRHRLGVAGRGENRVTFRSEAVEAVHVASAGVPRLINRIADRALHHAYAAHVTEIDAVHVRAATEDCGIEVLARPAAAVRVAPITSVTRVAVPPINTSSAAAALADTAEPLSHFNSESNLRTPKVAVRPRQGYQWIAVAAAATVVISASIGVPAWLAHQTVDGEAIRALVPPAAPRMPWQPAALTIPAEPVSAADPSASTSLDGPIAPIGGTVGSAGLAHAAAPVQPSATPVERRAATPPSGTFSILVASFQNRDRAERLVDELVAAGYGAHAVERQGGPNGRLVQVQVSGYASAIDVQRDLQRIRELPGGFGDARVVEQN